MSSAFASNDPSFVYLTRFVDSVYQKTNGAMKIDLFGDAQLGSETDNLKNLQSGNLQIGFLTAAVANASVPETLLFSLPYVFKDPVAAHKAYNGPAKQVQEQKLSDFGLHVIGWQNAGVRHIGGRRLFATPVDLKGVKIRVQQSPLFIALFQAFGAVPVALAATDVYSALQTGVVQAYDQPLPTIIAYKWYEVGGALTLTYHSYSVQFVSVNKQAWDTLPTQIKDALVAAAAEETKAQDDFRLTSDQAAEQQLKQLGATFLSPTLDSWTKAARTIYPQFASQVGGMSVIDKLISSQ